jgi:hypothetical protein
MPGGGVCQWPVKFRKTSNMAVAQDKSDSRLGYDTTLS